MVPRTCHGESIVSSINGNGYPYAKEWNWSLILYTEINSKWIADLNIRPETVRLLEKQIRKHLCGDNLGHDFFAHDTKFTGSKKKSKTKAKKKNKSKPKSFYTTKVSIKRVKRQPV